MKNKTTITKVFLFSAFFFTGCTTVTTYQDAGEASTLTTDFSRSDLQQNVMAMVDSMLANPVLDRRLTEFAAQNNNRTPIISVTAIDNQTGEFIDGSAILNSISSKLLNSGKFDFVDLGAREDMSRIIASGQLDPLVDSSKAVKPGTQVSPDYMLNGSIMEMRESSGRLSESYFKLTMKLHNLRTGRIDWMDEKEIRKQGKRPIFGK